MSMSEFDEKMNREDACASLVSISGHIVPDDFSDEDISFAQELGSLFDVEQENLPPYFVQTLLDAENPRYQPVEQGFEHKARARVFRRLKLKRRLFKKTQLSLDTIVAALPARRPLMAFSMALMIFMLMTIIVTGPSFASGMEVLLSGNKTGVMGVSELAPGVSSRKNVGLGDFAGPDSDPDQILLSAVLPRLPFSFYIPTAVPDSYRLKSISLYPELQQPWLDGPVVKFTYILPPALTHGTGVLTVGEFKLDPSVKVLQVVKSGAAQPVEVAQNGQPSAIYVDGQWIRHNNDHVEWVYGQRSEIIYQRDGVIFWLVGDQLDGMNEQSLMTIANSLQPMDISSMAHHGLLADLEYVNLPDNNTDSPFNGDVLQVYSGDAPIGPYLSFVGESSDQPVQPTPTKPVYLRPDLPR